MAPSRVIGPRAGRAKSDGLTSIGRASAVLGSAFLASVAPGSIGPVFAAEKLPSGEFLDAYASVDGWSLRRVSADKAGRRVLYCEATWTRESDLYVYVTSNPITHEFAFGIPTGIPAGRKQAKLRVWFDDDKAGAATLQASYVHTPISGSGDDGYLVASEAGDKPSAAERLAKARKVTFAYPFDGKTRVEAFPYKSGARAMGKLAVCARGR